MGSCPLVRLRLLIVLGQLLLAWLAYGCARQQAGGGQQDSTRVVGHLERDRRRPLGAAAFQQYRPPRSAELLCYGPELGRDQIAEPLVGLEDRG